MKVKGQCRSTDAPTDPGFPGAPAPVPNERAGRMLQAAGEVFLSQGYGGARLGAIVARSGGSLRDLYQAFGNKEALFLRVMGDLCEDVLAPLRGLALDEGNEQRPVEAVLLELGRTLLRVLLAPRTLALHRLVVGESPRFPALGRFFFRKGPRNASEAVAAFLERRTRKGELAVADPRAAGAMFIHAVVSDFHLRALTGGTVAPAEVEAQVRAAVRLFLDGVGRARP